MFCVCVWRPRLGVGCGTTRESRLFAVNSFPVFGFPMQQIVYSADFYIIFVVFGLPETFS